MTRRPLLALLSALALAGCGGGPRLPDADPSSLRTMGDGRVLGAEGAAGSHVWRAIPYARPPLGELRWRAPQPPEPWTETLEALAPGAVCPQLASPLGGVESAARGTPVGEEDCLTLDVYAPRHAPEAVPTGDSRLPVMVWIHGGGNVVGSAGRYDGGRLAAEHGLLVVVIQYRLGPLGWMRHAALRAGGGSSDDLSGNFGNLDQILALEWVRANAAAFGGDPNRVTIFGESAGGRDVASLLISPRARGLFHRAIVQSGGVGTTPAHEGENRVDEKPPGHRNSSGEVLLRLLESDGIGDREAAMARAGEMAAEEVARRLRAATPAELMAAYQTDAVEDLPDVPQHFRDGRVLPDADPLQLLARPGATAGVPVVFGTNRDEWRVFQLFDERYVSWLLGLLPRVRDEAIYQATSEHMSRYWKATGVDQPAARLRRAQQGVWAYRFDWDEEPSPLGLVDGPAIAGAFHGLEIAFVFGHWDLGSFSRRIFDAENEPGREELAAAMMSYWAQVAHAGSPGRGRAGDLPEWLGWSPDEDDPQFMVFDTEADGGVRMDSGIVRTEDVVAAVNADDRLETPRQRCALFREMVMFDRGFGPEQYESAGAEGCADYPLDAYPWEE